MSIAILYDHGLLLKFAYADSELHFFFFSLYYDFLYRLSVDLKKVGKMILWINGYKMILKGALYSNRISSLHSWLCGSQNLSYISLT